MQKSGERLTSILSRNYLSHLQKIISPVRSHVKSHEVDVRINGSRQLRLFRIEWQKIKLGYFYELVTAGLYGGVIGKTFDLEEIVKGGWNNDEELNQTIVAYPDIHHEEEQTFFEVKANFVREKLKLSDRQISLYEKLLRAHPEHALYHVIYKYPIPKITTFPGNEKELYASLAKQTLCSIVLPFSVSHAFHRAKHSDLIYRYNGELYDPSTAIRSTTLNKFFDGSFTKNAEEIILQLNLNPDNYIIERKTSPYHFSIEGNPIKQFPILWIEEKKEPVIMYPIQPQQLPIMQIPPLETLSKNKYTIS